MSAASEAGTNLVDICRSQQLTLTLSLFWQRAFLVFLLPERVARMRDVKLPCQRGGWFGAGHLRGRRAETENLDLGRKVLRVTVKSTL